MNIAVEYIFFLWVRDRGLWVDGRAEAVAAHGARIRRGRNSAARDGVGRSLEVSPGIGSQAGRDGISGCDFPGEVRRRGDGLRGIRDHHRGIVTGRWLDRDHRRRAQFAVLKSYLQIRDRRAEEEVSDAAGVRQEAGMLVA